MDITAEKKYMTLKDLKERVDATFENESSHDCRVCIPNNSGGMGGLSVTGIIGANRGIDWDTRKFILWPENKLQEVGKEPVNSKEWKEKSKEWAEKQMEGELGKEWDRDDPNNLNRYYSWIFMFLTDLYNLYHKY